jgi:riboflavin kinase / FMN adenylyltransferase
VITLELLQDLELELTPTVVTIGKFDGVHLGHQQLISETINLAEEHMLVPALISFDRHPASTLQQEVPLPLIGPGQKKELLDQFGIELFLKLPFDENLATCSAEDFVRQYLVEGLKAKAVVVGEEFRFGAGAQGDVALLKELGERYGFMVRVIPALEVNGRKVSTSWIRELLLSGEVVAASKLLGRYHCTTGMVEHGLKIGRQIGFPTANMARDAEGFLPRDAVYAGWLHVDGERYMTALSVGINETFTAVPRLLEAHILDVTGIDLYDKVITCEYVEFIRPAAKFNGVEDLVAEINRDLVKIREILG